jgi:Tfp pilus assembly protein PilZ
MSSERRKQSRHAHIATIALESLEPGGPTIATMHNYSENGLYFESDVLITHGKEIFLGIADSPYSESSKIYECHRVKVKWCKELYHANHRYGYGVEHRDPPCECPAELAVQIVESPVEGARGETRKHPRKSFPKSVFFTDDEKVCQGLIKDISRGGIFIRTDDRFPVGHAIRLLISATRNKQAIVLRGRVVHLNETGIGLKFTGMVKGGSKRSSRRQPSVVRK